MRKLTQIMGLVLLLAVPGLSDTLVLKTGEKISGYYEGGSARVIKFRTGDGVVKDYDLLSVQQIQFGDEKAASNPPASNTAAARSATSGADPKLVPGTERVTRPTSSNA